MGQYGKPLELVSSSALNTMGDIRDRDELNGHRCVYCGIPDAIYTDRTTPRDASNTETVMCCEPCFRMKGMLTSAEFIEHIACIDAWQTGKPLPHPRTVMTNHGKHRTLTAYREHARKKSIKWGLSKSVFQSLTRGAKLRCYYCGLGTVKRMGIDRLDTARPFSIDNCVTCCKTCSVMRRHFSLRNMFPQIRRVLAWQQHSGDETQTSQCV